MERVHKLKDGESIVIAGHSGNYIVERHGEVYSCSCPAWKFQKIPADQRTCKHINALLGDDAPKPTLSPSPPTSKPKPKRSKLKPEDEPPKLGSVMLANNFDAAKHTPTGRWMSEKVDGIRAIWYASIHRLYSRQGKEIFAPAWWTASLPDFDLDGELWIGRGKFQEVSSVVRKLTPIDAEWQKVMYCIFEAPSLVQQGITRFADRYTYLTAWQKSSPVPQHIRILTQVPCESEKHLQKALKITVENKGEGIMLRDPETSYTYNRSDAVLKVKPNFDEEGMVIGYTEGKGKYEGHVGAYMVVMRNGTTFKLSGMTDVFRMTPHPKGTIITFNYKGLTDGGIPRFAAFDRVAMGMDESKFFDVGISVRIETKTVTVFTTTQGQIYTTDASGFIDETKTKTETYDADHRAKLEQYIAYEKATGKKALIRSRETTDFKQWFEKNYEVEILLGK